MTEECALEFKIQNSKLRSYDLFMIEFEEKEFREFREYKEYRENSPSTLEGVCIEMKDKNKHVFSHFCIGLAD